MERGHIVMFLCSSDLMWKIKRMKLLEITATSQEHAASQEIIKVMPPAT